MMVRFSSSVSFKASSDNVVIMSIAVESSSAGRPSLDRMICINSAKAVSAGSTCEKHWNSNDEDSDDEDEEDDGAAS